jgi:hypothetical protein
MKLWLIAQSKNNDYDNYDTYSSAVVAAETEDEARHTFPHSNVKGEWWKEDTTAFSEWTHPNNVIVNLVGEALPNTKAGVICASFHAG